MAVHVNTYGHMRLDLLTMEIILVVTVHVLLLQDQPLPLLLVITITVNQELETLLIIAHIISRIPCGMVQVVLLVSHVVPILINHDSIIS